VIVQRLSELGWPLTWQCGQCRQTVRLELDAARRVNHARRLVLR
jgi:hypothetical protein